MTISDYRKQRSADMVLEENLAAYADRYFFDRLSTLYTYERIPWGDVESRNRQLRGEDVVLHRRNYPDMIIDEKAKVYGLVNKVLSYPSFEILCRDKNLGQFFESWFVSPKNTTTHYAMISIASDKDERSLLSGDINCMVYALINVRKLKDWLQEETGKTLDQMKDDAWNLLESYSNNPCPDYRDESLVYKKDILGKAIYLKISPRKWERPVNLVVKREYLRVNKLVSEIYIDQRHLRKYTSTETDDLIPMED